MSAGISSERLFIPGDSGVTPQKVSEVLNALPQDELRKAMSEASPTLDPDIIGTILTSDMRRMQGLAAPIYPYSYGDPIRLFQQAGILSEDFSLFESGCASLSQWGMLNHDLQPTKMIGVDYQPHFVGAARVVVDALQSKGFLRKGSYQIMGPEDLVEEPRVDVSLQSLLIQYAGIKGALQSLRYGLVGVSSDFDHRPQPVSKEILESGWVPIHSQELGETGDSYTGFAWRLNGKPRKTRLGDVYNASLVPLLDIEESERVVYIPRYGDQNDTKLVVYEERERGKGDILLADGWGYTPRKQATPVDIANIKAFRATLHEIYGGARQALNEPWDGNNILGLPRFAVKEGLYAAVMMTYSSLPAPITLSILGRHRREVEALLNEDKLRKEQQLDPQEDFLSHIGQGKMYQNADEFYQVVGRYLPRIGKVARFYAPPIITAIVTQDKKSFQKIIDFVS